MSLAKFALIYWPEEDCTSIEPTIAVIGVTADNVNDRQEVRAVEWRAGKGKAPEGGFPVFKGQILKASDQKEELRLLQNEVANAVRSEEDMPSKRVRMQSKKLMESKENFSNNKENEGALQQTDKDKKKRERDEKKKAKQAQIESAQKAAKELLQLVSNHQNVKEKRIKPRPLQNDQNPTETANQTRHKPLTVSHLTNAPGDSSRNVQIWQQNFLNPATRKLCADVSPQKTLQCMSQRTFENDAYLSVSEVLCESHEILYTPSNTPSKRTDVAKDSVEYFQQEIVHLSCQLEKEKESQSSSAYQIQTLQEHVKRLQEKIETQNEEIVFLSSKIKQLESEKEKEIAGDHSPLIELVRQFISDAKGHIHLVSQTEAPSRPQTKHTARDSTNDATSAIRRPSMLINESSATVELSPGSAVVIDPVKLEMIRRKSNGNASKLIRLLMEQYFSDEQMVGSSALGLKSKKGLDARHLSAIKDYVYQKHPKTKESELNLFVNRKCADVRKTMRKAAPKEN